MSRKLRFCQIAEQNRAKLPKKFVPNYRKLKKIYYFCGVKDLIYRVLCVTIKMILTAIGEYAYRRPEDGIYIVPIGCLKH